MNDVIGEGRVIMVDGREEVPPELCKLECQKVGSIGKVREV